MATISDFISTLDYKLPSRQLLPSQSRSNEPLTAPQIRTLWLHALALFRPFDLRTEDSIMAHKHLLKHLIGDKTLSSPEQNITLTATDPRVTIADLLSRAHAPYVLFLYLNCGLIRAWLGEYRNATLYFHTAIHMDDRRSPSNTAALYYLLGCAYFMLEEWKHSRKSFERCLLCFRNDWGTKPAELELVMAAPWVSTLNRHENGARSTVKNERRLESEFMYRVFIPCPEEDKREMPKSVNHKDKEWDEWVLERTSVETNLIAARTKSGKRRGNRHENGDEQIEIIGLPGGVLFWPVEISNPTAANPSDTRSSFEAAIPTEQPTPCPPPHPQLPEHKAPAWNEETQSFEPYLPSTATRFHTPFPLSHLHESPSCMPRHPKSSWVHTEFELPIPPHTHGGSRHFDRDIIAPSDYDYSPPLTQESSLLDYYMNPHSADFALDRQSSKKMSKKERNRQRLERAAKGRLSARGEALAVLVGRREGESEGKSSNSRFKGLMRRSVASLRRGSKPENEVEEKLRRRSKRNVVQEGNRAEVRNILNVANELAAEGLVVENAIEEDDDVEEAPDGRARLRDREVQSFREGNSAKARKMLGLGYEFATDRLSVKTAVEKYDKKVKELSEETEEVKKLRAKKAVVSNAKVRRVLGLEDGFQAGELSARRAIEEEYEKMRELFEDEEHDEMDLRERELGVSRAKARKMLGLSYGLTGQGSLSPRSVREEDYNEEEMEEWSEYDDEGVEGWVEEPREEEETGVLEVEAEESLAGLGDGGTLLPRAYKP
ncbi:MAG: hypothetical protein HETSPECPRED_002682 [Heterodermia speciosa]|uniref:Uncharacterized protein n=1 Tax=Heterodermia speciosa TaxID=116794 RepID=A0A8H3J589_9LECA|nr:MAG: hypothetical protein HETSPECPRED_002682 [Heterodermia speciosa]